MMHGAKIDNGIYDRESELWWAERVLVPGGPFQLGRSLSGNYPGWARKEQNG